MHKERLYTIDIIVFLFDYLLFLIVSIYDLYKLNVSFVFSLFSVLSGLDQCDGVVTGALQADLVTEQVSNVVDIVLNHGRSLQTETPGNNADIGVEAHRLEHFRAEDTTVADFDPFLEGGLVAEDFETGLCVGVVGGLEAKLLNSKFLEELVQDPNEVTEGQAPISNHALNLMKLGKVSRIQSLIPEINL